MTPETIAKERMKETAKSVHAKQGKQAEADLVLPLATLRRGDIAIVGGKCANLGELISAGVEVPGGFAVTTAAFDTFLDGAGLRGKIEEVLSKEGGDLEQRAAQVRQLIEDATPPAKVDAAVREAYEALCADEGVKDVAVAVRSSATGEDLPDASFAGQQDTFLNVQGAEAVVSHVRKCWASLYTSRAVFYREEHGFGHDGALIGVAVQRMVASESAGVCFTLDPVTGDTSKIVIESTWGLGEALVSGAVSPDRFVVEKSSGAILERHVSRKRLEHVPDTKRGLTKERPLAANRADAASLTDEEIHQLADTARRIEQHFGGPQDIEFAVEWVRDQRRMRIVQARPETVWSRKESALASTEAAKVVVRGLAAGPGRHGGKACVVLTPEEASQQLQPGDILVTGMTNPDWVPFMRKAGAIVTDDGGVTCHAAIVSREMGLPCIVGTRKATKELHGGQPYTVDGKAGVVYDGIVENLLRAPSPANGANAPAAAAPPVTSTRVYVNLSIPERAEEVARETQADGVGLLRAEHMMLSVGKHPRLLIEEGGEEKMIEAFAEGIRQVAAPFAPRPIVYRFLDFKPDEFLSLPGGEKYEREAGHVGPNPLIGYRGCFRYTKEPDIFRLECRAVLKVREEHQLKNVHVMLPFVRTLRELRNAKRIMEEEGLRRRADLKLWMMCEVPATVFLIDEFLREGLDGISFGTNDLTMLILGIDRDDASIQEIYDERNPAVLRAMGHVIRECAAAGVTTSVCGQAPSNYPEVVEFLVREGATSMSVNPDKVLETKHLVASIERKLILEGMRTLRDGHDGLAPPGLALPPAGRPKAWRAAA
jgi:pyruvate,water dikinase